MSTNTYGNTLPLLAQIERVNAAHAALAEAIAAAQQTTGLLLRDTGTSQALAVAPLPWVDQFAQVVEELAATGRPFTSEDVTDRVGQPRGTGENKNNAVGALMMRLARQLHLQRTGHTRVSSRAQSRGRLLCEWVGTEPVHG